jgi:hypothetical protein
MIMWRENRNTREMGNEGAYLAQKRERWVSADLGGTQGGES